MLHGINTILVWLYYKKFTEIDIQLYLLLLHLLGEPLRYSEKGGKKKEKSGMDGGEKKRLDLYDKKWDG